MDPDSTHYASRPFRYSPDPTASCEDETAWCVETYSKSYLGTVPVSRATLYSDNTVYAQLTLDVGPEKVAEAARKLGIRESDLPIVPALGLGAASITPLEMASAYATLAAGGIYSRPIAITKLLFANGKEDPDAGWGEIERERVIEDWVAAEVTEILEQNHRGGTGSGAAAYFYSPAAGKTGTTDEHTDAWYCAYTPTLSTTVWVGYPQGQIPMRTQYYGGPVAGGTFPALIWGKFMEAAFPNGIAAEFPVPESGPDFEPFTRGQYANSYAGDDSTGEETTTATTTGPAKKPKPAPAPAPAPPPEPAPPPTTTEPAPAPPPEPAPPPSTEPPPPESPASPG
jgi:penicillin-binding protein 1A